MLMMPRLRMLLLRLRLLVVVFLLIILLLRVLNTTSATKIEKFDTGILEDEFARGVDVIVDVEILVFKIESFTNTFAIVVHVEGEIIVVNDHIVTSIIIDLSTTKDGENGRVDIKDE